MKRLYKFLFIILIIITVGSLGLSVFLLNRHETVFEIEPTFMETVFVEGGTFTMGMSDIDSQLAYPAESPAHEVTLSDFHIGKYEVTVGQFAQFIEESGYVVFAKQDSMSYDLRNNPKDGYFGLGAIVLIDGKDVMLKDADWRYDQSGRLRPTDEYDRYPVVHVCVPDAKAYCAWLAMKTGKPFRLPTEAEWEYAARGGQLSRGTVYSGSDIIDEVAWYRGNSDTTIHRIGTKLPNELGIYDMSGNVAEWCADMYLPYTADPQTNPLTASRELVSRNVIRGGSWYRYPSYCRTTDRYHLYSVNRGGGVGFRVVY